MLKEQILLSLVVVAENQSEQLEPVLRKVSQVLASVATNYEIVVVDNGSEDDTKAVLHSLTLQTGLPDILALVLTKSVDFEFAAWAGIENALGDYVVVFDPVRDDPAMIPTMVEAAMGGAQVVFAQNEKPPHMGLIYRAGRHLFSGLCKAMTGIDVRRDVPEYRLLSRQVVNIIQQYASPSLVYRWLPATAGFAKATVKGRWDLPQGRGRVSTLHGIERGMQILMSTTQIPIRVLTTLCLFGAVSNLAYSGYVILVSLLKSKVAEGWVTLSLQQSGMFFLISLVLLVLGEYVLHMAKLSNEGPHYYIAHEFTSAVISRQKKLNVLGKEKLAEQPGASAFHHA